VQRTGKCPFKCNVGTLGHDDAVMGLTRATASIIKAQVGGGEALVELGARGRGTQGEIIRLQQSFKCLISLKKKEGGLKSVEKKKR